MAEEESEEVHEDIFNLVCIDLLSFVYYSMFFFLNS